MITSVIKNINATGTFEATPGGFLSHADVTIRYVRSGSLVYLQLEDGINGTSNASSFTIDMSANMPATILPRDDSISHSVEGVDYDSSFVNAYVTMEHVTPKLFIFTNDYPNWSGATTKGIMNEVSLITYPI